METEQLAEIVKDHITVDDAAKMLGRSERQIYNYADEFQWRDKRFKRLRFFRREDVEKLRRELA